MTLDVLKQKIEAKDAKVAVIGLGYVGLPVAAEFARVGFDVIGVDVIEQRLVKINAGESPIEGNEPGLEELLAEVTASGRLHATSDYEELVDRDVILIDVQTPVDGNNEPRYVALSAVLKDLRSVLKKGALVIVESTIAPGTMRKLVQPLLEEDGLMLNEDFYLGNCPERVMPGKLLSNLRTLSRVVGGMTHQTAETMVSLYSHVVEGDLDAVDCVTAEIVKTAENAYRDVQIAFANEVALICEAVGGDVWKVRELVNKSPGRHMLLPGAGVGGHCIPKDSWLLAYGAKDLEVPLRVIPAARMTNDAMPLHMAELLANALGEHGIDLKDAKVLVMGYAYLEDSDDTRNSPSEVLVQALADAEAEVVIHDPYVPGYQSDLLKSAEGCDAVVLMVKHHHYKETDLALLKAKLRHPVFVDGRRQFDIREMKQLGFTYSGVGIDER